MRLQLLSLLPGLAASAAVETPSHQPVDNANHVFNAIHSSLRQWGSSLQHNGMSFFLASVPEGTQFYHGRHSNETVKGIEWLAFEPEHAMVFAGPRPRRPPPGHGKPGDGPGGPGEGPPPMHEKGGSSKHHDSKPKHDDSRGHWSPMDADKQAPMEKRGSKKFRGNDEEESAGYLHTYRTKHPLSLLYIDGMSAGKTNKGTLDSTDSLLLGWNLTDDKPHGRWGEDARAQQLCDIAASEWGARIDGFLRMEMGFEIILCDFEKHLDTERVTQVAGRIPDERGPRGGFGDMTYYRAVAARFDGIGGNRVQLNYDDFVTAYAYGLDLFHGEQHARLLNVSNATLSAMRADVTRMVFSHTPPAVYKKLPASTNWQNIADMVVERYSSRFPDLVSSRMDSLEKFQAEATAILRPYIDFAKRDSTAEVARCATPFLPREVLEEPESAPLAAHAIQKVTTNICSSLVRASHAKSLEDGQSTIQNLMDYLQWTTWKRCSGCDFNEVCFIPIWPAGRTQDYENPQCQSSLPNSRGDSYWGGFGPRDGGKDGHYPPPPPPYPLDMRRGNYEL
ncbi:hypothetical protein IWZ00DRAFT_471567 [Phyllosticta capitalensis]|uniref:Uncharacterized protein n=1 Tax=Phyllosticta capitalensis TaxID=121624 RepID=A0ABR1YKN2_9PEZI